MQSRFIHLGLSLLLIIIQVSSSDHFKAYKIIEQAHQGNRVNGVRICSQQTFMVTWNANEVKIWNFATLKNIKTYTYVSSIFVVFAQLHPIDCRVFVSIYNLTNSAITVLDPTNFKFNQVGSINYHLNHNYGSNIVFIPEKRVFYVGGGSQLLTIAQYNADTYQQILSINTLYGTDKMTGYYNHQLQANILAVLNYNTELMIYNMKTLTSNFVTNNILNIFLQFSKQAKYLIVQDLSLPYPSSCLDFYDSNQNQTDFQFLSSICPPSISDNVNAISSAYSDQIAVIGGETFLQMIQLNQNNSLSLIDKYQMIDGITHDFVQTMSQVNGIIAVGTSFGNVILTKVRYFSNFTSDPFSNQTSNQTSKNISSSSQNYSTNQLSHQSLGLLIAGVVLFFVIIIIIYRYYNGPFKSCLKLSNQVQNQNNAINDNLQKQMKIEANQKKIKKRKNKRQDKSKVNNNSNNDIKNKSSSNLKQFQNQNKNNDSRMDLNQKQKNDKWILELQHRDIEAQNSQKIINDSSHKSKQTSSDESNDDEDL